MNKPFTERVSAMRWTWVVCLLLLMLGIAQDFFHSYTKNYNFYTSESLLFNSFWLLFIPFIALLNYYFGKKREQPKTAEIFLVSLSLFFAHLLSFCLFVNIVSGLLFNHSFDIDMVFSYAVSNRMTVSILIFGIAAVLIKIGNSQRPDLNANISVKELDILVVNHGKTSKTISIKDVLYFRAEMPYIAIITAEGKYLYQGTLKAVQDKLDQQAFIRIHKSTIVNARFVASFESRKNGDYDLKMSNGDEVRLSRNYLTAFRKVFQ